ncbi:ATP-grasp domain-containing protein [Denitromonas sp.]|uniref:arsenate reductase/protein-tyrosine-phosphatase family protein n=1 Tax=Denitromonas sp. TaxID=2734609 RepID=UPI003A8B268C
MTTDRILILDADLAPALSVARSLKEIGVRIDVASSTTHPITAYSRAVERCLTYPDPLTRQLDFIAWIRDITEQAGYALIIPVTERTVAPLLKHRDRYNDTRVAMAPTESLRLALDKAQTVALAESVGIPVPRSVLIEDIAELDAARARFDFPIVIKPVSSVGADQSKNIQLTVSYAFDDNELRAMVQHALRFGHVILQEYFRGEGEGIELLADHGEVIYAFQHRRLHEVPLTGGGSSLRMSVEITPALLDASRRLMAAMKWHGVAMVEFKHDPVSGQFRLMEVNGRFWGSLPLAAAAGANFPGMLYGLLVKGKVGEHPPARPGVYCRNLSRDVYWHEQVLRKNAPARLVSIPGWRAVLKDALLMFSWRHAFDVQRWSDPKPGLVDVWRIVKTYQERLARIRADKKALAAQRKAWQKGIVRDIVRNANHIHFVCYGNINRSAVAERYARAVFARPVTISSSGFHPVERRAADPVMVDVAREAGLDMTGWASTQLTRTTVDDASVIFVMELNHFRRICQAYPDATDRTFLLAVADPRAPTNLDIEDPYGKAVKTYRAVYQQIVSCIDRIARPDG